MADKLMLKNKSVDQGDDESLLQQIATGRRKYHFNELPSDKLLEKFTAEGSSVVADSGEEFSDTGDGVTSPTSPRSPSQRFHMNGDSDDQQRHRIASVSDYEDDVFFTKAFDASEVEKTCIVAFTTVNNIPETTSDTVKQQLRDYIERIFRLPKSRVEVLTEIAANEESPELKLICKVSHARALTAKDANGKSDPYCRLGLLNEEHLESHLVKHKDLVHWKKEGWVDKIETTSIKLASLDPDWNEEFELSVTDSKREVLVLEVWDSDDEEIQKASQGISHQGKGVKNLGNFLTDLRKGIDDFMGRCFHPLQSIPIGGEVKTFVLRSHSGKSKHGFISLSFNFRGVKENTPLEVSIWEHTMLTRAMVNESSRMAGSYVRRWDAELPKEAERLLEQHATLNGLNKLQQAAIRLSVLVKYHKLYAVSVSTIRALLHSIKEHKALLPRTLTPEDVRKGGDKAAEWIVQLFSDLLEISTDIDEIFKNHLNLFSLQKEQHVKKLEDNLLILRQLYSFRPFTYQLPPEKRNLKDVLENSIEEATRNWFTVLEARLQPTVRTAQTKLESLKSLSENCLKTAGIILKQLGPMFMEEGVSYFTHFYITMDSLLGTKGEETLKSVEPSAETASATFEIYITFRGLSKLTDYLDKNMEVELKVNHSYAWFQHLVQKWIDQAIERCRTRIRKAIQLDEAIKSDEIKISTSAIDVCGFLMQVGEFLKHLDWPDAKVAFGLMVTMVQQMSDCAQLYLKELYEALENKYDKEGQFLTSEELSVALNNMHHVRTVVKQLPEKLKFESLYTWLDGAEGGLGANARNMVNRVLESADEDCDNKIRQIVEDTARKLSPDILKAIKEVIAAPEGNPDNEVVGPLLNYLAVNLQTLGDYTYSEVFSRVLLPIWDVSVQAVLTTLSSRRAPSSPLTVQRLTAILDLLRLFLNADGNGLDFEKMDNNPTYKEALLELKMLNIQPDELDLQFFSDLVALQTARQESGNKELGELLLTVDYNRERATLNVLVIQGRNLPVMDKDGSSDPYVQLSVLPQWKYPETSKKVYKTQVEKGTLDPYFNKEFSIPIPNDQMSTEGGILLLTVFDHDIITSNDFTGTCAIALNSVPDSSDSSYSPQRNRTLPLFVITEENKSRSLVELGQRLSKGDTRAASFFKTNKKILGNLKKLVKEGSRSSLFFSS